MLTMLTWKPVDLTSANSSTVNGNTGETLLQAPYLTTKFAIYLLISPYKETDNVL